MIVWVKNNIQCFAQIYVHLSIFIENRLFAKLVDLLFITFCVLYQCNERCQGPHGFQNDKGNVAHQDRGGTSHAGSNTIE